MRDMKFRHLMLELADCIGRHHLPIMEDAHEIGEFLGDDAIHHEIVKDLVRSVYKANRCGHLNAEVTANRTFDAIGGVRGKLLRSATADLDAIQLLEQLDFHVGRLFSPEQITHGSKRRDPLDTSNQDSAAEPTKDSSESSTENSSSCAVRRFNANAKRFV